LSEPQLIKNAKPTALHFFAVPVSPCPIMSNWKKKTTKKNTKPKIPK
jgi:predicted metal-binding transcription factor (methanogenesis marker protein 9)